MTIMMAAPGEMMRADKSGAGPASGLRAGPAFSIPGVLSLAPESGGKGSGGSGGSGGSSGGSTTNSDPGMYLFTLFTYLHFPCSSCSVLFRSAFLHFPVR